MNDKNSNMYRTLIYLLDHYYFKGITTEDEEKWLEDTWGPYIEKWDGKLFDFKKHYRLKLLLFRYPGG